MSSTQPNPSPSGRQWRIAAHGYEAVVVEVGGGLRSLRHDGVDLIHGYAEVDMADAARGQVLAPWPNRIRDGRYTFDGDDHVLPLTEPERANAAHGLVRWMPWERVGPSQEARTSEADEVTLGVTLHPQPGWAWTLRLEITYRLDSGGLQVTPRATNLSPTACPFGFGMHPYLTAGEANLDAVTLTLPARTRLDVDERLIPTGRTPLDAAEHAHFADGTSLRDIALDTCFTDLHDVDGRWRITVATSAGTTPPRATPPRATPPRATTLWADAAAYPYVQLFSGDGLPAAHRRTSGLAVEPMTCPADAFNSRESLLRLEPGQTWSAPFGITSSVGA